MFGISFCRKINCYPIIHFGDETDTDVVEQICTNCEKKYFQSNRRKKRIFILLLYSGLSILIIYAAFSLWHPLKNIFKAKVEIEENFGFRGNKIPQDSFIILDFFGNPSKRIIKGAIDTALTSDTLPTSKAGNYRIIYEIRDTQYVKDIQIIPNETYKEPISTFPQIVDKKKKFSKVITPNKSSGKEIKEDDRNNNKSNPKKKNNDIIKDIVSSRKTQASEKPNSNQSLKQKLKGTKWYKDNDSDNKGDPSTGEITYNDLPPDGAKWIKEDDTDQCPLRDGNGALNGCPNSIGLRPFSMPINSSKSISISRFTPLSDDIISWVGSSGLAIKNKNGVSPLIESVSVGLQTLNFSIKGNSDQLNISKSIDVCVKIDEDHFKTILNPVIKYGQYDVDNAIPTHLKNSYTNSIAKLSAVFNDKSSISVNGRSFGSNVEAFIISKIGTQGTYVQDVKVTRLKYDISTCKVDKIDLEIIK